MKKKKKKKKTTFTVHKNLKIFTLPILVIHSFRIFIWDVNLPLPLPSAPNVTNFMYKHLLYNSDDKTYLTLENTTFTILNL